jgi:hypothetical protein
MDIFVLSDAASLSDAVEKLAKACNDEIAKSKRPTDAFPIEAIIPLFLVATEHAQDWVPRVLDSIWKALGQLTQFCYVYAANEADVRNEYYALDHDELLQFRKGTPILKFVSAIKPTTCFNVGSRTKHQIEINIREALEFEVFRRDIEIGALQAAKARRLKNKLVVSIRGSGLEYLREHAWVDGVPSKGLESKGLDREIALFGNLRTKGETLAIKFIPGAKSPSQVETAILRQLDRWDAVERNAAEYDEAIASSASSVRILMKACACITRLTQEKHVLSKATKKANEIAAKRAESERATKKAKKRWRPRYSPIPNPMTKARHKFFSTDAFTPFELVFIAYAADVDPNLLSTTHVLATTGFRLARSLRRAFHGQRLHLELGELKLLHELINTPQDAYIIYPQVRQFLKRMALELRPREQWATLLNELMMARA